MRHVSLAALRRIVINAQMYSPRSRSGSTREVEAAIRKLSCVQLDSISTVERSHRIALAARVTLRVVYSVSNSCSSLSSSNAGARSTDFIIALRNIHIFSIACTA